MTSLEPEPSGFDYSTTVSHIKGIDGVDYPITSPLIPKPHRPRGGWTLRFQIKGMNSDITGTSAHEAISKAVDLFHLNGIEVNTRNLWFNANIQWLGRAVEKHQRVYLDQLLSVADAHASHTVSNHEKPRHPVSEWGSVVFEALHLYLANEAYSYETFLTLASEFASWMNPSENRTLGSSESHIKMTLRLAKLKRIPLYSQREARQWLSETLVEMGFDNSKLNYWV